MTSITNEYPTNIVHYLLDRHLVSDQAHKIALIDDSHSWSYQQLARTSQRIAAHLSHLAQDCHMVGLVSYDHGLSAAAFLAVIKLGKVVCPINPELATTEVAERLAHIEAEALLMDDSCLSQHGELAKQYVQCQHINKLATEQPTCSVVTERVPNVPGAFCLFTSGTTGHAQAVIHRHQDVIVMNEHYGKQVLGLRATDVFTSPSKMYFAYGLNSLLFALYWGATVRVFAEKPTARELWSQLATEVSVFFGVPRVYKALLEHDERPDELSCRLFVSAGDKLPNDIQQQWLTQFGQPILDGIGTTEVLSTFISNRPGHWRYGSTGWPVPGFEIQLLTSEGEAVAAGQAGVLWVRGDTYPDRYVNNELASLERFQNGWFNTNDLFCRDQQGWLYYLGRWGDMLLYQGSWLSPYKLEEALVEHPAVNDAAVVSVNKGSWSTIIAWVALNTNEKLTDDLREKLCNRLSHWIDLEPYNVRSLQAVPATPAGKKKRFLLKRDENVYID